MPSPMALSAAAAAAAIASAAAQAAAALAAAFAAAAAAAALSPGGSADFELRASAAVGAGVLSFHNALQRRLRQDVGITVLCHDGTTKIAACWPWNAIEGCHLAHDENGIGTTEAAMSITVRGLGVFTFEASQLFAFSTELGIRVAAFRRNRREARALAAAAGVDARRFAPTRDRPTSPQLQ
jgi:hypothetical protein